MSASFTFIIIIYCLIFIFYLFIFLIKDKKDKKCRFIFTATFLIFTKDANVSGGHCLFTLVRK
ncbi:putative WD repeat-containing protein C126.01c [Labeo rohita]|uniref:WD repeat-containing protein C126.01c n=1 Tax=Labeo rohita TaxID=84645 RepID=A0ABQ8MNX2_LABRO|nr:putative WD repeat-containing protein C126.01c [Labeo rohita]